jgi:hypothetical protein
VNITVIQDVEMIVMRFVAGVIQKVLLLLCLIQIQMILKGLRLGGQLVKLNGKHSELVKLEKYPLMLRD